MRRELKRQGYEIIKNQAAADIIIAHSAGCFWLHDVLPSQKLMLIGPPYWPEKTMNERAKRRAQQNLHFKDLEYSTKRWLAKNLWGCYYALRDARRTLRIIKHGPFYDLTTVIAKSPNVLLVRNEYDPWLTDKLTPLRKVNPKLIIKRLPGDHEDWYFHAKPYVDLLTDTFGPNR